MLFLQAGVGLLTFSILTMFILYQILQKGEEKSFKSLLAIIAKYGFPIREWFCVVSSIVEVSMNEMP